MQRIRKLLRKSHAPVGLQIALAMMLPAKGKASSDVTAKLQKKETSHGQTDPASLPELTGRWDFSRLLEVEAEPEVVGDADESTAALEQVTREAVETAKTEKAAGEASKDGKFVPQPMTHEEIRLWLQSFNAGPYATLKYKGDVPYEETKNYVPRVLKYYEEIKECEYDDEINKYAAKYGLDPGLIRAIMYTESSFRNDTVSHAGARGLMQVMPVVWEDIMKKYDMGWEYSTGVFEPEKNIEVACAYLAWLRYDFLPRHFEAYDHRPNAPKILVRDHDRGVPDRESPRIIAKSDETTKRGIEVASAEVSSEKAAEVITDSGSKSKSSGNGSDKKSGSSKVIVTDSDSKSESKSSSSNGKKRVSVRGGKGKAVAISVGEKGEVRTKSSDGERKEVAKVAKSKRPAVSKSVETEEEQGG